MDIVIRHHIGERCRLGYRGAQKRARGAHGVAAAPHAQNSEWQGDEHFAHLLDQLRDGCRHHAPLALHEPAEGAHHADKQQARRDDQEAERGFRSRRRPAQALV
ncbi:hypothetical protein SDC9_194411 [bioreactor metagenome]|uniref:Uncharacterized protein n=1 Tax=bioreactor metagenome TaxID=1076179 RepID=A0A645I7R4_9ZZZZ